MEAQHMDLIDPDCISRLEYYSTNSDFCILSNEMTLLGVLNNEKQNQVVKESLLNHEQPVQRYEGNFDTIYTVLLIEDLNIFLAGEKNAKQGRIVQYDLHTAQVIKTYSPPRVGFPISCARFKNLCFFGCYGSFSFITIDVVKMEMAHEPVKTSIRDINSITVCEVWRPSEGSQTILTVSGKFPDFSGGSSDIFDISDLVSKKGVEFYQVIDRFRDENSKLARSVENLKVEFEDKRRELESQLREREDVIREQTEKNRDLELEIEKMKKTISHLEERLDKIEKCDLW